jgi:hypothetical protein
LGFGYLYEAGSHEQMSRVSHPLTPQEAIVRVFCSWPILLKKAFVARMPIF